MTRLLDDIRDFVQSPSVPATDWCSVLLRSWLNYNMEEIQAPRERDVGAVGARIAAKWAGCACEAGRCA